MKKHSKHLWNEQPAYKKWVKARDRALEQLHARAQQESSDVMRKVLTDTLMIAKAYYPQMKDGNSYGVDSLEHMLKSVFSVAVTQLYHVLVALRSRSYTLSKSSEAEIIARMSHGKHVVTNIRHDHLQKAKYKPTMAGGQAVQRLNHYMDRMRRKIVSFAQGAALNAPDQTAFLIDVMQCFPKKKMVRKHPRRILKPELMEATHVISDDPAAEVSIDNIDDAAWQDMLDSYMTDYVPQWRDPAFVVDLPNPSGTVQADGTEVYYAWEYENDITNEFVQSVRDGQKDAATENGITDFVVISIIDSHTCDNCCGDFGCADFDGLLVSEVEEMTGGDQTTPSYHPGCRCTLAPATENVPDKPDDNMNQVFDDWLST